MKSILYIHGFNSSPLSVKAEVTKQYLAEHHADVNFICPQIKSSPLAAISQLKSILQQAPQTQWYIMGSSLGGYFSTYLAEQFGLKAVLINPAVKPFELLKDYLGEQQNPYTNEQYQVTEQHIEDLRALYSEKISKKQYMVMVQTGDEVLDYQQAVARYHECHLIVQQGGDHSFVDYENMLPEIMTFFGI